VTSQTPERTQPATPWHRARRVEIVLFLVTFLVFAATASRSYLCLDVWSANFSSYQIATTGSPYLDGLSVPELDGNSLRWVWIDDHAPNGHIVVTRSPAVVIAGLPAYLLTQPSTMTVIPGAITAALLTAFAVLLMYLALVPLMRRWQALAAVAAFAFTTPVWSVAANGIWPQTITVLGIAVVAWAAVHEKWWVMGLGGVLLLWARPHAALIVAVVGLVLAWRERRIGIALRAGLPGVGSLVLLSLWSRWVYGSWNPIGLYGAGGLAYVHESVFSVSKQLGMWIAPDRGLLIFTPVLLVLLPALLRSWRSLPAWSTALLLGGLAYTVLQNALIGFNGGDPIYGYRCGLEFLACAFPAFALSAPAAGRVARRMLAPVLAVQFVVIALGAVVEHVALDYRMAWTNNAFVHAMVAGSAALRATAVLMVLLFLLVVRLVRISRVDADAAEEPVAGHVTVG
jgi:alpha-1,2-mannosyltransferase